MDQNRQNCWTCSIPAPTPIPILLHVDTMKIRLIYESPFQINELYIKELLHTEEQYGQTRLVKNLD